MGAIGRALCEGNKRIPLALDRALYASLFCAAHLLASLRARNVDRGSKHCACLMQ